MIKSSNIRVRMAWPILDEANFIDLSDLDSISLKILFKLCASV